MAQARILPASVVIDKKPSLAADDGIARRNALHAFKHATYPGIASGAEHAAACGLLPGC